MFSCYLNRKNQIDCVQITILPPLIELCFPAVLTLSHIQQIYSRRLSKHTRKKLETFLKWMYNDWKHCDKRRNCLFWAISSYVAMFSKNQSVAKASEHVYMRERVKLFPVLLSFQDKQESDMAKWLTLWILNELCYVWSCLPWGHVELSSGKLHFWPYTH